MSIHRIKLIAALCAIAGFAGSTAVRANQDKSSHDSSQSAATSWSSEHTNDKGATALSNAGVHRASEHSTAKKFDELKGKKITGAHGEELGKVQDFVIDAQSGKIAHVVVSSGGMLGIGDKLRLMQHDSLTPSSDGFTAQLDKAAFEALPVAADKDLSAGKVEAKANTTSTSSDVAVSSQPSATDDVATSDANTPSDSSGNSTSSVAATSTPSTDINASGTSDAMASQQGNFVRASKLDGKDLRSGQDEIGEIKGVAIDLQQGVAMAIVEVKAEAGGESEFHVPFTDLQIQSGDMGNISTTLARSDFTAGSSSQSSLGGTTSASTSDEALTPTGRMNDSASSSSQGSATASNSATAPVSSPEDQDFASTSQSTSTDASQSSSSIGATSSGSTYGSNQSSASSNDAASAGQSTEPYGATADSSSSSSVAASGSQSASGSYSSSSDFGSSTSSTPASTPSSSTYGSATTPGANSSASMPSSGSSTYGNSTSQGAGSTYDNSTSVTSDDESPAAAGSSSTFGSSSISSSPSSSNSSVGSSSTTGSSDSSLSQSSNQASTSDSSSTISTPGSSSTAAANSDDTTTSATEEEQQLTPTGRDQSHAMGGTADAIRSALKSDPSLASEDVRVHEAGHKIMLQGKVSSEDVKDRIETLAKQNAGSAEIDSKLKVK